MLKRLLTQAGVSVLAGLLMSSAVLAQDVTADAGDTPDASIGIDVGDPGDGDMGGGDPDVSIDPNDPGLGGGDIGTDGGAVADGDTGGDGGPVADGEGETAEGSDPDVSMQFGTETDAPVEATFDITGTPRADFDTALGAPAESGSGDIGQTSAGNDGESDSHLRREVR